MNSQEASTTPGPFAGLDLLSSAVILIDTRLRIRHCNPAAENLFAVSQRACLGQPLAGLLGSPPALVAALENALDNRWSHTGHDIVVARGQSASIHMDCTVTPVDTGEPGLLLEFRPIDRQLRAMREEREAVQQQANRELIRNLAHEIKNPLGGIRGSAQLLDHELAGLAGVTDAASLREYTQVIIHEADRLQDLMHRLLSSHRAMQPAPISIHDILERVRRLIHAEFPGVKVRRDYDTSLPEITGDREQLIQAILNIVRNAAQAIITRPPSPTFRPGGGDDGPAPRPHDSLAGPGLGRPGDRAAEGEIICRTRAARQVTLAKKRHRLALELQITDNGPGIPEDIRDRIFYPLVSGREGGTGLGLALAQSFIQQHHGSIEFASEPGRTCFTVYLPLNHGDKA